MNCSRVAAGVPGASFDLPVLPTRGQRRGLVSRSSRNHATGYGRINDMSVRTPDPDWHPDQPSSPGPADSGGAAALGAPGWFEDLEFAEIRRRLPILYVEAVPVRVDGLGQVTEVGVLLCASALGEMTRTLVSGRVMYGETVRDALFRHLEKDLGPMAFPLLPTSIVPFSVAEYFPLPGISPFVDERQHAVSLAYVVPVTGTCEPRQDALEVTWLSAAEAAQDDFVAEMGSGRGILLRQALASVGAWR